ncbi:hypothetical protein HZA56_14080 [Candidatus Poribacteria bacterium]|nr:hypothetical protein [Candidatus Poribacteria bacterium]
MATISISQAFSHDGDLYVVDSLGKLWRKAANNKWTIVELPEDKPVA